MKTDNKNIGNRLKTIERKVGLKQLKELSITHSRSKYPDMPEAVRSTRNYTDKTANGLTKCVIDFLTFSGHQAERINSTGRYLDNSKIITDVVGSKRRIGSGKWIKGSGQKGTADISATIWGQSVKVEIKMKDSQSESQKKYQDQVQQAGGLYWICHSFEEFISFYNGIM